MVKPVEVVPVRQHLPGRCGPRLLAARSVTLPARQLTLILDHSESNSAGLLLGHSNRTALDANAACRDLELLRLSLAVFRVDVEHYRFFVRGFEHCG